MTADATLVGRVKPERLDAEKLLLKTMKAAVQKILVAVKRLDAEKPMTTMTSEAVV